MEDKVLNKEEIETTEKLKMRWIKSVIKYALQKQQE